MSIILRYRIWGNAVPSGFTALRTTRDQLAEIVKLRPTDAMFLKDRFGCFCVILLGPNT
ncbi:MAG: hypothetical protein P4M09_13185 [Devosia sp.]|nr:hypothetical protein [Devosia sp.]